MKKMIFIIISLLISSVYGDEVSRRFLVENQDLPEAVKISYLSDQKGFNQYFADTYLWAKKDSHQLLTLGLAAYHEKNNHKDFVSEDLKGIYTNLFYTRGFGKKSFLTSYQSIGWFSDKSLKLNANQMKYYQISKLGYQVKKNLNLSVGFLSSTNYYEPLIVPFVGFIWSHKNFLLDLEAPIYFDCQYQICSYLKLIHKLESDVKSYRKEDGQILQINSLSGKSGIDYSLSKHIVLNAEYIYYQRKEFFLQSSENQKIKKNMNPLISFNLKIKA